MNIFDAGIGSVGTSDISLLAAATAEQPPMRFYGAVSIHVLPTDPNMAPPIQPPIKLGHVEIQAVKYWVGWLHIRLYRSFKTVILNKDPRTVDLARLDREVCVEQTWMGGVITYPKP